ncbi:MAG: DinB family protein [Acidobacteriota bacterium]
MFEITTPTDRETLAAGLGRLQAEIHQHFSDLPLETFFAPQGEFWSPEGHLRHLNKSVRAVGQGMAIPKLLLRLRFGASQGGSRPFEAVREQYLAALADGSAQAGSFAPSAHTPDLTPAAWKAQILGFWQKGSNELLHQLERWRDPALDRCLLPHPILGKLTVREMLFFTLYHNAHHARRVVERSG